MSRNQSSNYTVSGEDFMYATEGSDQILRGDIQKLAKAVENHQHSSGQGAPAQRLHASQAAGDTFYATAAGVINRLAVGTAYYVKRMNAAGTAPEWALLDTNSLAANAIATADITDAAVTQAKLGTDTLGFAYVPIFSADDLIAFSSTGPTNWGEVVGTSTYQQSRFLFNKDKIPTGATVKLVARGIIAALGATAYSVIRLYNLTTAAAVGAVTISMVGSGAATFDVKASADLYADLASGENKYCLQGSWAEASAGSSAGAYGAYLIVEW